MFRDLILWTLGGVCDHCDFLIETVRGLRAVWPVLREPLGWAVVGFCLDWLLRNQNRRQPR